jgi:hypothetical protein
MNHREPPHPAAAVRKAFSCLTLALLPAIAPAGEYALPRPLSFLAIVSRAVEPTPYLPVLGAPPLRFQPALSRPDSSEPVASFSSNEALSRHNGPNAPDHTPAVSPAGSRESPELSEPIPAPDNSTNFESETAPAKSPPRILPDDARPSVRPEDFLPYFQIPGSARKPAGVTLLLPALNAPPAPANLPASSATYTQSPR